MWCRPKKRQVLSHPDFTIRCVVTHAISAAIGGSISCACEGGTYPILIEWLSEEGRAVGNVSDDQQCALDLPPGTYTVVAQDADARSSSCDVEVKLSSLPVILGYRVTHASCGLARDGNIEVFGRNLRSRRFLWTTGVMTSSSELHDASPGVYTATPMHEDDHPFVHACSPAVVLPSRKAQKFLPPV
jgi:hypothetical protein